MSIWSHDDVHVKTTVVYHFALLKDQETGSSGAASSPSASPPRPASPKRQFVEEIETAKEPEVHLHYRKLCFFKLKYFCWSLKHWGLSCILFASAVWIQCRCEAWRTNLSYIGFLSRGENFRKVCLLFFLLPTSFLWMHITMYRKVRLVGEISLEDTVTDQLVFPWVGGGNG